jgi:hypothetical protein
LDVFLCASVDFSLEPGCAIPSTIEDVVIATPAFGRVAIFGKPAGVCGHIRLVCVDTDDARDAINVVLDLGLV